MTKAKANAVKAELLSDIYDELMSKAENHKNWDYDYYKQQRDEAIKSYEEWNKANKENGYEPTEDEVLGMKSEIERHEKYLTDIDEEREVIRKFADMMFEKMR